MKNRIALFTFVMFILTLTVSFAQTAPPKNIDKFVENVQKTFEVPGISIAIVKDGKVVLAKGYGVKKIGTSELVDSKTLFAIASNTKVFTATALAILVEEGKIEWDKPVINYLPWFQLSDPYVTREITVRDLLVHRSGLGLGAGDLLWWPPTDYTRREIVRRLRYIPLVTSFRYTYAYDNALYGVAGVLIEEISGKTWEDFVFNRILKKVGMINSGVNHSDVEKMPNVALSHSKVSGVVKVVAPFTSDATNPAGGIVSCAEDMAKWLICQIDSGRCIDGTRLFSPRTTRDLHSIVTPLPIETPPPELAPMQLNFNGYALGLSVRDYRGKKIVTHTGGLTGYVSRVTTVPELRLGVSVLTNQEVDAAFACITNYILDHYIGAPKYDWITAYNTFKMRNDSTIASMDENVMASRDSSLHPSLPLAKYTGTYTDAWYGDVIIEELNGKLVIRFKPTQALVGDLEHYQHDTFIARWHIRELNADAFVTFSLNPDGSIDVVKMRAVSASTDFSYDFHDLLLKPKRGK
jgi:CubicO group peptidase (beta-lactamase class C family)